MKGDVDHDENEHRYTHNSIPYMGYILQVFFLVYCFTYEIFITRYTFVFTSTDDYTTNG